MNRIVGTFLLSTVKFEQCCCAVTCLKRFACALFSCCDNIVASSPCVMTTTNMSSWFYSLLLKGQRHSLKKDILSNIFTIFIISCWCCFFFFFLMLWRNISQLQPALVTHGNQKPATVWEWSWPAMHPDLSLDPILLIHLLSRQQKQGCVHRQPAPSYLTDLIELNLLSWSRKAVWRPPPSPPPARLPHPKKK